jgi:hypothetical protein
LQHRLPRLAGLLVEFTRNPLRNTNKGEGRIPTTAFQTRNLNATFIWLHSAVKYDLDLKKYYEREVASGKNKLSVLNAVKSKLLARVVSCVNHQRMNVKTAA